ncbi:MAG: MATE family efflux transporter [Gammaproteobacteria bacterium]
MPEAVRAGLRAAVPESGRLVRLAGPLIGNNLAIAGMNFADAVMAGRLGSRDLAAVAVGGSVWMVVFLFAMGTLMAISPLVAERYGAGKSRLIGRYVRQGFTLAFLFGLAMIALVWLTARPVLDLIGIDPEFRGLTGDYVEAIVLGGPGLCLYLVLRFTSEAIGWTRPIMYVSMMALVVNVIGNYALMWGNFGFPAMGARGCGLASAFAMWFMLVAMLCYVLANERYRPFAIFARLPRPRWRLQRQILGIGVPLAVTIVAEAGLFAAISLLMGTLSANVAAAHQIAVNFASTMFMIPLALNSATTVRVGQALGRRELAVARFRGWVGIGLCGLCMAVSAVAMLVLRKPIVDIYTSDPEVSAIAVSLLLVAAVFQISDGIQVGAAGALRGYQDTRIPMFLTTLAYWIVAFPLALLAAKRYALQPALIWGGFVVGLTLAAILLVWRYRLVSLRPKWR